MAVMLEDIKICADDARFRRMWLGVRGGVGHIRRETERLGIGRPLMLTLTYRDCDAWTKRDISDYIRKLRQWLKRRGERLRYVWVAELQKRGAVHYHMLVWARARIPRPDASGMWPHGMTKTERMRSGGVSYITKYLTKKEDFKRFPKGIRVYGVGGLSTNAKYNLRWFRLPRYVREHFKYLDDVVRAVGGGFFARSTGEHLDSPFQFAGFGLRCVYIQKIHRV